jgi:hypothetical protein
VNGIEVLDAAPTAEEAVKPSQDPCNLVPAMLGEHLAVRDRVEDARQPFGSRTNVVVRF